MGVGSLAKASVQATLTSAQESSPTYPATAPLAVAASHPCHLIDLMGKAAVGRVQPGFASELSILTVGGPGLRELTKENPTACQVGLGTYPMEHGVLLMAKQTPPLETSSGADNAPNPKDTKAPAAKLEAIEVNAPLISSEVDATIVPSRMVGSYLTVDSRMDSSDITVRFSAEDNDGSPVPGLELEDLVDSSGESGARKINIPLDYLTKTMGFTLLISYSGRVQGQSSVSLVKEVGVSFYSASESEALAPHLLHEKILHNTPTYDMHDHTGDEIVLVPVPPLAKAGDQLYCTAATEQDAARHVFYTVVYGYALTAADAVAGNVLSFSIRRGWLARRKPWRSLTLQCAWITSGLPAQPPADVPPHLETQLPRNALEIQRRRTAAFIVDPALDLKAPHLRQSVEYNGGWCLNPELTKDGGDVDTPDLDTYAGDRVCFFVSAPGSEREPLGCVTVEKEGDLAFAKLTSCTVAGLFNKSMTLTYSVAFNESEQLSPPQVVSVSVPQFTHAVIEEANDDTVNLNIFPGDATATVPVWAYAKCSNWCWMWVTGEGEDGSVYRFDILTGVPVTDNWKTHGVDTPIRRSDLETLADCSNFELHFAVGFKTEDLLAAFEFPVKTFHISQHNLELDAPKVCQASGTVLNPVNARDGVTVRVQYVGISPRHTLAACWKTAQGACWPSPAKPGNSNPGYVDFELPFEAVIRSIGKTVVLHYSMTSTCKQLTSKSLELDVQVPAHWPAPEVAQATGLVLDLGTFPGNANISVAHWTGDIPYMLEGQKVWLEGLGTRDDGAELKIKVFEGEAVTADQVGKGVASILQRAELERLADGSTLTFNCKVTLDGSNDKNTAVSFPPLVLTVVQENLILREPEVLEAQDSQLVVWNGREGVTVRVQYDRISTRHTISVCWKRPDGTCLPLSSKPGNTVPGYVDFDIPREAVIHGINKTVPINYTVVTDTGRTFPSPTLNLKITKPTRLPTPVVEQATPRATQYGVLDLTSFLDDALITVEKWWFALPGQFVWLKCTGTKKEGGSHTFYVAKGIPLTQAEASNGLSLKMSRSELELLKNESPLTVTCIAARDANEHGADAVIFPVLNLVFKRRLVCQVERFEDLPLGTFAAGGSIQTSLMKITFQSGSGVAGIVTYGNDSYYSGKHFVVCQNSDHQIPPQLHRFDFSRELESVRFSWAWKQRPATVTFYDRAGNVVQEQVYPDDWRGGFWVELITSPGTAVAWMTILVQDYSFIDNFSMCYRE